LVFLEVFNLFRYLGKVQKVCQILLSQLWSILGKKFEAFPSIIIAGVIFPFYMKLDLIVVL
jgi:hypothetical protein